MVRKQSSALILAAIVFCLWGLRGAAFAQLVKFKNFSVEDGLPESSVRTVVQDRLGFLWFGTQNGLVRYDGVNFQVMKPDRDRPNWIQGRSVSALCAGSDDVLWVATEKGLERLDRKTGCFRLYPRALRSAVTGELRFYIRLHEDSRGQVWTLNRQGTLERFDPRQEAFYPARFAQSATGPAHEDVISGLQTFLEDASGVIWVGTRNGLYRYDPVKEAFIFRPLPLGTGQNVNVTALARSERQAGQLWVGTGGGGFFRVPKETSGAVERFNFNPGVLRDARDWVSGIVEDSRGQVWFATPAGLGLLDTHGRRGILTVADPESLQENAFAGPFVIDAVGRLWFRSLDWTKLILYDPASRRLTRFGGGASEDSGFNAGRRIDSIVCDRSGVLWVGSWIGGLNRTDPGTENFLFFTHKPGQSGGLPAKTVRAVLENPDGTLWLGVEEGLCLMDPTTGRCRTLNFPDRAMGDRSVMSLCRDGQGRIWAGTTNGLYVFDPKTEQFTRFFRSEGVLAERRLPALDDWLQKRRPLAVHARVGDKADLTQVFRVEKATTVLVVCQGEFGVAKVDYGWIETIDGKVVWEFDPVVALPAGGVSRNRLDVDRVELPTGTYRLRYRSDAAHSAQRWSFPPPARPAWWGIQVIPAGDADFLLWKPLLRPDLSRTLRGNAIRGLAADASGLLWIGTERGLSVFDPKRGVFRHFFHRLTDPESLSEDVVVSLLWDRGLNLWVGTNDGGLNRFKPATLAFDHFLPSTCVTSLHEDSEGRFWGGTFEEGLFLLDRATGNWTNVNEKDGLSNDLVSAIDEDAQGRLWVGTARGLSCYDPRTRRCRSFNVTDGLETNNRINVVKSLKDGRLAIGGTNGLTLFRPGHLWQNPYPPEVALTGFRLLGELQQPAPTGPLTEDISVAREIRLPLAQNTLAFEFAVLHFASPEKNRCRYRLEGFDPGWVDAGLDRTARYTNLDAGEYVFHVQGCNADGVWSTRDCAIRVVVTPPFWRTPLAYGLFAALAALALYGGHRFRVWQLKRSEIKLKRLVLLRTWELSRANRDLFEAKNRLEQAMQDLSASNTALAKATEVKGELLRMAAHDLKNPLTAITGFAKLLKHKLEGDVRSLEKVRIIGEAADRMFHLISELLETSAIEDGRLVLNRVSLDLGEVAGAAVHDARAAAERKRQVIELSVEADCRAEADPGIVRQIMDNLVGNAIKFSPFERTIWVTVGRKDGGIRFGVRDEGPGLTEEDRRNVFGKFQKLSARPTGDEPSSGLGLSIVKALVELHGGRISVESEEGRGAHFLVWLPQ